MTSRPSGHPALLDLVTILQELFEDLLGEAGISTPSPSGSTLAVETSRTTEGSAEGHIRYVYPVMPSMPISYLSRASLGIMPEGQPEDVLMNEELDPEILQYIDFPGPSVNFQQRYK